MALILSYSPSFESEEFKKQLKSNKKFDDDIEIEARKKKYNMIDGVKDKPQGKLVDDDRSEYDPNHIMYKEKNRWRILVESCVRNCTIRNSYQIDNHIQIIVPRVIDFEIEINTRLLLSMSLSKENQIWLQELYNKFHGGENELYSYLATYNEERENRNISMDEFDIISYGKINRLDSIEILDQFKWYENHIRKNNPDSKLIIESTICNNELQAPYEDPLREGEDTDIIHNNLRKSPEKKGCSLEFEIRPQKITTLFAYPEFKIKWVRKVIKVGCARISIKWPRLMTRLRKKVLYFSAFHVEKLGRYLEKVVKECLKQSSTISLVVILASQNIGAGLAVFRTLFERCIYSKITQKLECFFPELFIQIEKTNWRPF